MKKSGLIEARGSTIEHFIYRALSQSSRTLLAFRIGAPPSVPQMIK